VAWHPPSGNRRVRRRTCNTDETGQHGGVRSRIVSDDRLTGTTRSEGMTLSACGADRRQNTTLRTAKLPPAEYTSFAPKKFIISDNALQAFCTPKLLSSAQRVAQHTDLRDLSTGDVNMPGYVDDLAYTVQRLLRLGHPVDSTQGNQAAPAGQATGGQGQECLQCTASAVHARAHSQPVRTSARTPLSLHYCSQHTGSTETPLAYRSVRGALALKRAELSGMSPSLPVLSRGRSTVAPQPADRAARTRLSSLRHRFALRARALRRGAVFAEQRNAVRAPVDAPSDVASSNSASHDSCVCCAHGVGDWRLLGRSTQVHLLLRGWCRGGAIQVIIRYPPLTYMAVECCVLSVCV
jgi:hypothetical protein